MDGGISALAPAIAALAGIGGALGSQWLSHVLITSREKRASEDKEQKERHFISIELVLILEQYAEGCARVAADAGDDNDPSQPERLPTVNYPELNLQEISGDWRVLKALLMYRIRELPVLQNEARSMIEAALDAYDPPFHAPYFHERQYQFARLGMKAVILAMRLRKSEGLPETRLRDTQWSAYNVLWKKWRDESKRRIFLKRLEMQQLAAFEIMNSQRRVVPGAELTESRKS